LRHASADHMHAEEGEPQPFSLPEPTYAGAAASHVGSFLRFFSCSARLSTPSTESTGIRLLEPERRYSRCGQPSPPVTPSPRGCKGRDGRACRAACRPGLHAARDAAFRYARHLFNAADPPPCDWFGYVNHAHASARASMRVELLLAF